MAHLPLQGCFRKHLQLSLLQNDLSAPGDTIGVPLVFIDLPSQELAFFGRTILEDFNHMSLPCFQVRLCLGPEASMFRCIHFIRVERGEGKIETHNGEVLQGSELFGSPYIGLLQEQSINV